MLLPDVFIIVILLQAMYPNFGTLTLWQMEHDVFTTAQTQPITHQYQQNGNKIMKQLIEIKALPPFLLHLQTGEELRVWLLKNDLLTEKVFVAGNRLIFECEAKHSELYFKN